MEEKCFFEIVKYHKDSSKAKLKVLMVPEYTGKRLLDEINSSTDHMVRLLKKAGVHNNIDLTSFKRFAEICRDDNGFKILSRISCRIVRNPEEIESKMLSQGFQEGIKFEKVDNVWRRKN